MAEVSHEVSLLLPQAWPVSFRTQTQAVSLASNQTPPCLASHSLGWRCRQCSDAHFVYEVLGSQGTQGRSSSLPISVGRPGGHRQGLDCCSDTHPAV